MKYKATVVAIMAQNLTSLCKTGDPDDIYRLLSSDLLACKPDDLLFLLDLLRNEIGDGTDASCRGLSTLVNRFFGGLCDVLYGLLAERIATYKEDKDFLPLGQILGAALEADPKILHEVGQMVYQDGYTLEIIERAQQSPMYKYHGALENHFEKMSRKTNEREDVEYNHPKEYPDWHHPAKTEIRIIRLIDVVSCFVDANATNVL